MYPKKPIETKCHEKQNNKNKQKLLLVVRKTTKDPTPRHPPFSKTEEDRE